MAAIKFILCGFLFIFFANGIVHSTKLNYPRVLLPIFDKISINFTLEVIEKGCFKWTSSRQDLILITPIYENPESECSYHAKVTVLSRERRRNTAIVLAEDLSTGESLRCDVILDVIDKLGVHTTTRQLYLEEAPETFELHAEDSQGNAFTTLEGVEFNWSISSLNQDSSGWSSALRFLTFTESIYHEVPPSLEQFEAKGVKGYMVLLEGVNTGTAKVTVNIPYPEYSSVAPIEVYINILANIILEPSDVHILPGDTINFRILQLKMGKLHEISLNDQYFLEVEDSNIANIKKNSATGLKLGRTSVILRDRNVPNDKNFLTDNSIKSSIPSAQLTVSNPMKLGLNLLPYNNWITVSGEKHEIALDLYTSDDQKITLGSRYMMTVELDETIFNILKRNKNGSRLFGEAIKEGTTPIYGSFKELTVQAELLVFNDLQLIPKKIILPYDPNIIKTQKIQFHASGGDGSYIWHSQNAHLLHINQNGLAQTVIRDTDTRRTSDVYQSGSILTAHTLIKVALAKNPKIIRHAEIFFLPPVKLEIIKYNFETALKDYVRLHVGVYAFVNKTFIPFERCENLVFDFEMSNSIFDYDSTLTTNDMVPGACQIVHLRSKAVGLTNFRLSYKFQDKLLKDEVTLSAFERLNIFNPVENEIVLPIGSSRNIIYANGPQRIYTLEADLIKTTTYDKQIAIVQELSIESQNPIHVFNVLCLKIGKTALDLSIHNTLLTQNFEPYISNVITTIRCAKPRFLNLYATQQLRSSCPMDVKHSLLHLKEREDKFEIEIEVQDAKNHKLMNITSLLIDWQFIGANGHRQDDSIKYQRRREDEVFEGIRLPGRELLVSSTSGISPNFRIKGIVSEYDKAILTRYNIKPESPQFGVANQKTGEMTTPLIENEIRFMAVNSTLFTKNHISIFMAKNRKEHFPLAHGSGFYTIELSEPGIISVEYDAKQKELVIVPLRIGHVQLDLTDRCLTSDSSQLSISVVTIGGIDVEAADRVERTKSIEAIIKLYDSNDNLLQIDHSNLHIYELNFEIFNPDILSVKLGEQDNLKMGEIRYIITGSNLGGTKIVFTSGTDATLVSSETVNVQVFPPLRLYPRNSTLVIGSNIQIFYQGGPQPNENVVFQVHDKKIISMDSAIVTAQKLGVTQVIGQCIMKDLRSGREIVISEDNIQVQVVPLTTIQIRAPLNRIRCGAIMPASIWGTPDLSPMVLGTLKNIKVSWSTNQADVLEIFNIFAIAGIEYNVSDLISVRIKALNPGKAKVYATIELPDGTKLKSAIEVTVFKVLELTSPKNIKMDWILMPPRSTLQLKANLDDTNYKLGTESSGIVKVSTDGVLRSSESLGRDLVFVKTFEQSVPINVEVKNIQYIMASMESPTFKLKHVEDKIPRGLSFMLKVSLHDNLGNEFSHNVEDVHAIKYSLSHKDIVDVQIGNNLTVMINAARETDNMIAISLKDTTGVKHAEDYVKLSIAESQHIFPTKGILSVGDIICFDSPLIMPSIWRSTNEQILSINKATGLAEVVSNHFKVGEKIMVINGNQATGNYVKYDVEIRELDVIQFIKSFDVFSGSTYDGYLVLRNHIQSDKFSNLIAKNVSKCSGMVTKVDVKLFKCKLTSKQELGKQLVSHYKVSPVFVSTLGRYACRISLDTDFNKILGIVKNNDVNLEIEAHLPNGLLTSLSLKFVPGVKVTPESLMAADWKDQELTVTGLEKVLQKVEMKPSNENFMEIKLITKSHGSLHYNIKILNALPVDEEVYINLHSPVTMQDIHIPVQTTDTLVQKCSKQPFDYSSSILLKIVANIGFITTVLVVILATFWLFVAYTAKQNRAEVNQDAFAKNNLSSKGGSATLSPDKLQHSTLYPDLASYRDHPPIFSANVSSGSDSMVYGNSTPISPQRRLNPRYI